MTEIQSAPGLFGWTPEEARGRGRPGFEWTSEKSNKIMVLFATGSTIKDAARLIGCDVKTLRKVFPLEVQRKVDAEMMLRTGMMAQLIIEIEQGNVGAVRQLDRMLQAERVKKVGEAVRARGKENSLPKLGKKAQARVDAAAARGMFEARKAPPGAQLN